MNLKVLVASALIAASIPAVASADTLDLADRFSGVKVNQAGMGFAYRASRLGPIDLSAMAVDTPTTHKIKGGFTLTLPLVKNVRAGVATTYDNNRTKFSALKFVLGVHLLSF